MPGVAESAIIPPMNLGFIKKPDSLMRKLLISIAVIATLAGCSRTPNIENDDGRNELLGAIIPRSLDRLPFIYRSQVQQGNII